MHSIVENDINIHQENFPLSTPQLRFWILDRLEPGNSACNVSRRYHLKGKLNIEALEKSFNALIEQNDILRTSIHSINGSPVQKINSAVNFNIAITDLSSAQKDQKEEKSNYIANTEAGKSFELDKAPLLRVRLIKLDENDSIIILVIHHIIVDGWSLGLIFNDIENYYNKLCAGKTPSIDRSRLQYNYYIIKKLDVDLQSREKKRNYWKEQLSGELPIIEIPIDKKRPLKPSFNGSRIYFTVPKELNSGLQEIREKSNASLYTLLLTAFKILIYKYTGIEKITIGSPVANRIDEMNNTIGVFINMLPLCSNIDAESSFTQLLANERKITFSGFVYHDYSFEEMLNDIKRKRDSQYHPVFQYMFQFIEGSKLRLDGIETQTEEVYTKKTQFDIALYCWQWEDCVDGYFEFNTDLYETHTIKQFSTHLINLLKNISENPDRLVKDISILSVKEENELIFKFNKTQKDFPKESSLIELFENSVKQNEKRTAINFNNIELSYKDLNVKVNKLSNSLISKGIKNSSLVGIATDRSIDMVVSVLAVLKSGAAYIPLDPYFPPKRVEYMINDSELNLVITQTEFAGNFKSVKCDVLDLNRYSNEIDTFPDTNPEVNINSSDLAYIIYTSGSTGNPKGVQITHRSVINFLYSMQDEPGITKDDILASVTTLSFDISVLEIFLPLLFGAKLVLIDKSTSLDGNLLHECLQKTKTTIMQATPSTWRMLLKSDWKKKLKLKMLCGGEPLALLLAQDLLKKENELWNLYGPTETTIWSSVKKINTNDERITIGKPIANTEFYVLDENKNIVSPGVYGELHIGGDGLSKGYLHNEELTSKKFIQINIYGIRKTVYATGDTVRCLRNGEFEFGKRIDNQVKIRGYRIELGDIETHLLSHNLIEDAAADVKIFGENDSRLVAYLVAKNGTEINSKNIREYLQLQLPEYMIPSHFQILKQIPLTPNGKVDRKALPLPEINSDSAEHFISARNNTEERLTAIWEDVLRIKKISVKDDFFELGGHSLLAAEMFFKINKKFNKKLPLSILFTRPTIEGVAKIINNGYNIDSPLIVPIKSEGKKTPLFLVHGAGGNVFLYRELAKRMDGDRPVYGIQARSRDGINPDKITIKDMAAEYVKEMKLVQENGPYYLGGYCMGGTIALEIAQQLIKANEEVAFLGMMETYNIYQRKKSFALKFTKKLQNLVFHTQNFLAANSVKKFAFLRKKLIVGVERQILRFKIFIARFAILINFPIKTYPHFDLERANDIAQEKYSPSKYFGKVTLFRPKKYFVGLDDKCFGWDNICEELEVVKLNVNPRGMLVEPFVDELAKKLNEVFRNKD